VTVTAATTDQLADLRGDLADTAATPAFSDVELQRLWQRANGRHERTLYLAVRQLLMQANRLHDYMLGQGATDQKKSQVTSNLREMLKVLAASGGASATGGSGLASLQFGTANTMTDPDDPADDA
jgi:hypothetical protein